MAEQQLNWLDDGDLDATADLVKIVQGTPAGEVPALVAGASRDQLLEVVEHLASRCAGYQATLARVLAGARHNGTETSEAAARSVKPNLTGERLRVLNGFLHYGHDGATTEQVEHRVGGKHQTVSARVHDLDYLGWLEKTGSTGVNTSGRRANKYRVSEEGRRQMSAYHELERRRRETGAVNTRKTPHRSGGSNAGASVG